MTKVPTTLPKMYTPSYKDLLNKQFTVGTSTYMVTGIELSAHPQIRDKREVKLTMSKVEGGIEVGVPFHEPTTKSPNARMRRRRDDT